VIGAIERECVNEKLVGWVGCWVVVICGTTRTLISHSTGSGGSLVLGVVNLLREITRAFYPSYNLLEVRIFSL
jgi:hypothetical protein